MGIPRLVHHVSARPGHRLYLEYSDGVAGEMDLTERIFGPVFEPLRDPALFEQVRLDEFGAPVWPNGADLAPDALYLIVSARTAASSR